jgi:endoglucanase
LPCLARLAIFLVSVLGLAASGCSALLPGSGGDGNPPAPAPPTGCPAAPTQPMAPGGYYVNGNTICTADGRIHLFHGVDRPSLEWTSRGENLSAADFQLMATWKANSVRIALNQDFWLSESRYYDASYAARVDSVVNWAEDAGMDPILDLHWSDAGVLGSCDPSSMTGCQQLMADANSLTFWSQVADRYKNDGRVVFELYNEPHNVSWVIWKAGGRSGSWQVAGMQQLYDTVRATGAENLVVIGGLDFAYDLSGVPTSRISGHNILYATHPYNNSSEKKQGSWDQYWGFLTATDPVIVTEFGDGCSPMYSADLIAYADLHAASWTAWAWFPGGCTFPSIIDDWNGTPSAPGMVVKAALAGYHDPAAGGARDAGTAPGDAGTAPSDAGTNASDAGTDASDASSQ